MTTIVQSDTEPLFTQRTVTERSQSITAAPGSAGAAVTFGVTTAVAIWNTESPKWDIEYRVGTGAWLPIGPRKSVRLDIDLSTTTLALRRGDNSVSPMVARLTFEGPTAGVVDPAGTSVVPGDGISDPSSLTLAPADRGTVRLPAGTQTYTINAATAWSVGQGIAVFLPASGTVSFAVSGGPTLNGGTSTLTRTLAGNSIGYVVLNRIAGTDAYALSGA